MNIKQIIKEIENGERGFINNIEPSYYEKDYTDGATETYAVFEVEGTKIAVLFSEKEEIRELKDEIYNGTKEDDDLIEAMESVNDFEDQFVLDKVVATRDEDGYLEWI